MLWAMDAMTRERMYTRPGSRRMPRLVGVWASHGPIRFAFGPVRTGYYAFAEFGKHVNAETNRVFGSANHTNQNRTWRSVRAFGVPKRFARQTFPPLDGRQKMPWQTYSTFL